MWRKAEPDHGHLPLQPTRPGDANFALLQSYSTGRVIRIPMAPQTVGDHIRKKRLGLKMLQRDVAKLIAVVKTSVVNWEGNRSSPEIRYMPAIIRFLGYIPLLEGNGWGERLVRHRTTLGLSQKESAARLAVDPSTLAKWERGDREPTGVFLGRVKRFLGDDDMQRLAARRVALPLTRLWPNTLAISPTRARSVTIALSATSSADLG